MINDAITVYAMFAAVAAGLWPVARGLRWLSETPIDQRRQWLKRADDAVLRVLGRKGSPR